MLFWGTVIIFGFVYIGMLWGRLPWLGLDRTGVSVLGGIAVVATGILTFPDMIQAIDFDTIALLLGMMVVLGSMRQAGFMEGLSKQLLGRIQNPSWFLACTMGISAILSALLVNDTICLALTPVIIGICRQKGMSAKPHLIGISLASNIGSLATLVGNPQNMIIGKLSGIDFFSFALRMTPVSILALGAAFAIMRIIFRQDLKYLNSLTSQSTVAEPVLEHPEINKLAPSSNQSSIFASPRFIANGFILIGILIAFLVGVPLAVVALSAMGIVILLRRDARWIFAEIDWELLMMFSGLFVVVHAFHEQVVVHWSHELNQFTAPWAMGVVVAILSNLVSNVPAVLLLAPLVPIPLDHTISSSWLIMAMMSTLAGNLTIFASVANLIVVEQAKREKIDISLGEFCRAGIPITLVTMMIGVLWFMLLF